MTVSPEWPLRRKAQGSQQLGYHRQPGDLVFFEDAIGFRSQAHNPHLRPDKAVFIQDGYLKFRIGGKDIEASVTNLFTTIKLYDAVKDDAFFQWNPGRAVVSMLPYSSAVHYITYQTMAMEKGD